MKALKNILKKIKIIAPAIKILKKANINISGPFPSDTIFLKNNLKNYDVVVGMYHDQVLAPIKTICGFDAINITLGLPFLESRLIMDQIYPWLVKTNQIPKA